VELTRDLSVAKVYFSLLHPDEDPKPVLEGLGRASGFLRGRLGKKLTVRHVPELRFVHDDSVAHGVEISRLIESAANPDSSG
jgi:ribosome-binding factor A